MTFLPVHSQNDTIITFLMVLKRMEMGHLFKDLIVPYMRENYCSITVQTISCGEKFKENKNYTVYTKSGHTLPSYLAIKVLATSKTEKHSYIEYMHGSKPIKKRVGTNVFGNQAAKIGRNIFITSGNQQKKLLFTKEYVLWKQSINDLVHV